MLEKNREILDKNYYLNKRKDDRKKLRFKGDRHRFFLVGTVLGIIILSAIYFASPYSRVFKIAVKGNYYLSDKDIIKLSGVNYDDKYLFVLEPFVKNRLRKSDFIEECSVSKNEYGLIEIEVKEKKIIGYTNAGSNSEFIFIDNSRMQIDTENMYIIEKVPLIVGYTNEQLENVFRGFKTLTAEVINEISEIHHYPFSYDEEMMEVIMRDGNYIFVSPFGLKMLENYYSIESGIQAYTNICMYLDEVTNSGYVSACPWEKTVEEIPANENDE